MDLNNIPPTILFEAQSLKNLPSGLRILIQGGLYGLTATAIAAIYHSAIYKKRVREALKKKRVNPRDTEKVNQVKKSVLKQLAKETAGFGAGSAAGYTGVALALRGGQGALKALSKP